MGNLGPHIWSKEAVLIKALDYTPFFRDHSPEASLLGSSPWVNSSLQVALDSLEADKTSTPDPLALETGK